MEVIPAVDVLDGKVVRLLRGDYERVTVYGDDPGAAVSAWAGRGARRVHVVDLRAARSGSPSPALVRLLAGRGVSLQVGGGIRTGAEASAVIAAGADRVVVGSAAVAGAGALGEIVAAVGASAVVAAVDVRSGRAHGEGWRGRGRRYEEVVETVAAAGVPRALVTGISRDGTLAGPDLGLMEQVRALAPDLSLIASGGVGSLDDLTALSGAGVSAVVVGRAFYEGRFSFGEAVAAAIPG